MTKQTKVLTLKEELEDLDFTTSARRIGVASSVTTVLLAKVAVDSFATTIEMGNEVLKDTHELFCTSNARDTRAVWKKAKRNVKSFF